MTATPSMKKAKGPKPAPEWHVLDADNKVLGRLATEAARLLLGKHRRDYTPHLVAPVYIIVTNTDKVALTGSKETQKTYYHYTGYPGGIRHRTVREQRERDSRRIISSAVSGMLPKNNLRRERLAHLKLYRGAEHPHLPQVGPTVKAKTK